MTTNNDDTQNEVSGITSNHSKNNGLTMKNAVEVITPNNIQTNSDDTNLTEKWKKGELKEGFYYIIKENGNEEFDYWFGGFWENSWNFDIKEVLAPVPSYEEWQAKDEENQQLKELIKECKEVIETSVWGIALN